MKMYAHSALQYINTFVNALNQLKNEELKPSAQLIKQKFLVQALWASPI